SDGRHGLTYGEAAGVEVQILPAETEYLGPPHPRERLQVIGSFEAVPLDQIEESAQLLGCPGLDFLRLLRLGSGWLGPVRHVDVDQSQVDRVLERLVDDGVDVGHRLGAEGSPGLAVPRSEKARVELVEDGRCDLAELQRTESRKD